MNTIREYIASAIWWLAHQLDKLANWVNPPFDVSKMTEEQKQQIKRFFKEN
jgi:hypothetical protein